MNYSNIKNFDIANGNGIGVSLFVSGCTFHCKECFNQETWDFNYGKPFTDDTKEEILNMLKNPHIDHFSVLGGEPMNPQNIDAVCHLIDDIHNHCPDKKIWIWTGYNDFEELYSDKTEKQIRMMKETFKYCNYITFGRFLLNKKNIKRKYSGSDNQYTLDLKNNILLED